MTVLQSNVTCGLTAFSFYTQDCLYFLKQIYMKGLFCGQQTEVEVCFLVSCDKFQDRDVDNFLQLPVTVNMDVPMGKHSDHILLLMFSFYSMAFTEFKYQRFSWH